MKTNIKSMAKSTAKVAGKALIGFAVAHAVCDEAMTVKGLIDNRYQTETWTETTKKHWFSKKKTIECSRTIDTWTGKEVVK